MKSTCCYIGISQIIVEWDDYQDERFCELTVAKTNKPNPLDQVHSDLKRMQ